jgi:hypothetical protein
VAVADLHEIKSAYWARWQVERRCLAEDPRREDAAAQRPDDARAGPCHALQESLAVDPVVIVVVQDVIIHGGIDFVLICSEERARCAFAIVYRGPLEIIPPGADNN